ncbi:MAG: HI1506-related protein [Desulfovibrio sp.]|uniref:HI1506-related protein n=1 Tax=Desulfovibrio sp. 7SRBS1 TaxID=3378064 RepID=UPI003B3FAC90
MPIRITSKRDGFRRCGVAHTEKPTDYPDDRFTAGELAVLKAEPMLVVVDVEDDKADAKAKKGKDK